MRQKREVWNDTILICAGRGGILNFENPRKSWNSAVKNNDDNVQWQCNSDQCLTIVTQTEISKGANQALVVLKLHANFYKHNILNLLQNPWIIIVRNTNTTHFFFRVLNLHLGYPGVEPQSRRRNLWVYPGPRFLKVTKGQFISKCLFGVFKSPKKITRFFSNISALSSLYNAIKSKK